MTDKTVDTQKAARLAHMLLAWYDVHRRTLPWRAKSGEAPDPYCVWLSEIMLQQTTVAAVADYYRKFLGRWPTVGALAAASLDDVLAAWAGLGYYARARNLHKCATIVARDMGGVFPRTADGLRELPGIGAYTAGAIAAIAFDAREAAVDANAERVLARVFAVEEALPAAKVTLRALGQSLVPKKRAGDFAQALMDLGATTCTPRNPACRNCPWTDDCKAVARGIAETLPRKGGERVRPLRRGAAFVVRDGRGRILLVKRPENGLLGGMLEPPLGPWTESFPSRAEALLQAPFRGDWKKRAGIVRHGFTHFELEIEVYVLAPHCDLPLRPLSLADARTKAHLPRRRGRKAAGVTSSLSSPIHGGGVPAHAGTEGASVARAEQWIAIDKLKDAALPTVMRKIVAHGLDEGGPLFAQARSARRR